MKSNAFLEDEIKLENGITSPFGGHVQNGFPTDIFTMAHYHDYIEILYCDQGSIEVFVNNLSYICHKGDMILINSKEIHYILGYGTEKISYFVLKIKPDVLSSTPNNAIDIKYILPFIMSDTSNQKVFSRVDLEKSDIPKFIYNIVSEYENKKYGFELAIHSYACHIFLWILRFWHEKNINLNFKLDEDIIQRLSGVFEYVDIHYKDSISVEDAAKICNMSYSYFSRFFKAALKRNFSEYVNYTRIVKAQNLLISTDMNITEIALETGFSSSSYFIQQFKLYTNISPRQYKKISKSINNL